jgi:hypothetical protein
MLLAGTEDGVYRVEGVRDEGETTVRRVLAADRVFRLRRFDALDGLFAAARSGLYRSLDGDDWERIPVPEAEVYAVAAAPAGDRLYVGTRPARLFVADVSSAAPSDASAWEAVSGFDALRDRCDWGLDRHDGVAQVRSLRTHPTAPDRLVAGVEVGGVHVSDDGGATWTTRRIEGFDAPHTDDVHHLAGDGETMVASTGSGLYRTTDVGRTWRRLDGDHRQRYFKEAFVHDGRVYAGGAPAHPATWDEDDDHALFVSRDGRTLERASSPATGELPLGWCRAGDDVLTATHRGTLLRRRREADAAGGGDDVAGDGDWERLASFPTLRSGGYLPTCWFDP